MTLGRGGRYSSEHDKPKKEIIGTVTNIKASPTKGMARVIAREKTGMRKTYAVDIDVKNMKDIERKETYKFKVEESIKDREGTSQRDKAGRFKTYYADQAPDLYVPGEGKEQFMDFSGGSRLSSEKNKKKT